MTKEIDKHTKKYDMEKVETREQRRKHPFLFMKVLEEHFSIKISFMNKIKTLYVLFTN